MTAKTAKTAKTTKTAKTAKAAGKKAPRPARTAPISDFDAMVEAHSHGIDFTRDYFALTHAQIGRITELASRARFRGSRTSPKSESRQYYDRLRRIYEKW